MITAALALAAPLAACRDAPAPAPAPTATPAPEREGAERRPRILFLGTSLTAGRGLDDPAHAYPARLQRRIEEAGLPFEVVNAGVSGETSAGALSRVDWLLSEPVAVLVIETGANDGLRGQDPEAMRRNIQAIVDRAREQDPPPAIVLLGMRALTNLGEEYGEHFARVFAELARENDDLALVPFLLEDVGGVAELNQPDGVHPTAEGHERMAENVWPVLEPILRDAAEQMATETQRNGAARGDLD